MEYGQGTWLVRFVLHIFDFFSTLIFGNVIKLETDMIRNPNQQNFFASRNFELSVLNP